MARILELAKIFFKLDEKGKNFSAWKFQVRLKLRAEELYQMIQDRERGKQNR